MFFVSFFSLITFCQFQCFPTGHITDWNNIFVVKHLSDAKTDCSQVNLKKGHPTLARMFFGVRKCDLNVQARISESFAALVLSVKELLLLLCNFLVSILLGIRIIISTWTYYLSQGWSCIHIVCHANVTLSKGLSRIFAVMGLQYWFAFFFCFIVSVVNNLRCPFSFVIFIQELVIRR